MKQKEALLQIIAELEAKLVKWSDYDALKEALERCRF